MENDGCNLRANNKTIALRKGNNIKNLLTLKAVIEAGTGFVMVSLQFWFMPALV